MGVISFSSLTEICSQAITIKTFIPTGTTTYISVIFIASSVGNDGFGKQNDKREEVLCLLRNVAKSPTEAAFHDNLKSLKTSDVWFCSPHLQNWFEKTWLVEAKEQSVEQLHQYTFK